MEEDQSGGGDMERLSGEVQVPSFQNLLVCLSLVVEVLLGASQMKTIA